MKKIKKSIIAVFAAAVLINAVDVYADGRGSGSASSMSSYGGGIREDYFCGANLIQKGRQSKNRIVFNAYMECREYVKKCRITAQLQVYEDGKYVTEVTSASTEENSSTTWKRTYYVESGKNYRAKVKFQSYDQDDKLVETKYIVTNSVTAP